MSNRGWRSRRPRDFFALMAATLMAVEVVACLVLITAPETPGRCAAPPEARFYAPPPGASWDI